MVDLEFQMMYIENDMMKFLKKKEENKEDDELGQRDRHEC